MKNSYTIEVLDGTDKQLVHSAAECIAQTFVGVQVGNSFIQEPMTTASGLSEETFMAFNLDYLEHISSQGLTLIARDKETGHVIGVAVTENLNPEDEAPVFDGELSPFNDILALLGELDLRFFEAVHASAGTIRSGEYAHMFMLGVRTEKARKTIAMELIRLTMKIAKEKGYQAIFGEATNIRSQQLLKELEFHIPRDAHGQLIVTDYAKTDVFHTIPKQIAVECQLMVKSLA